MLLLSVLVSIAIFILTLRQGIKMSALDDAITALTATVAAQTTVDASVVTFIDGIPALIASAVATATAQGATAAQLAAITALGTSLTTGSSAVTAAILANTPAAPVVPAPAPAV
jgi:hypothetical protein